MGRAALHARRQTRARPERTRGAARAAHRGSAACGAQPCASEGECPRFKTLRQRGLKNGPPGPKIRLLPPKKGERRDKNPSRRPIRLGGGAPSAAIISTRLLLLVALLEVCLSNLGEQGLLCEEVPSEAKQAGSQPAEVLSAVGATGPGGPSFLVSYTDP
jgi:hypothetical protein